MAYFGCVQPTVCPEAGRIIETPPGAVNPAPPPGGDLDSTCPRVVGCAPSEVCPGRSGPGVPTGVRWGCDAGGRAGLVVRARGSGVEMGRWAHFLFPELDRSGV